MKHFRLTAYEAWTVILCIDCKIKHYRDHMKFEIHNAKFANNTHDRRFWMDGALDTMHVIHELKTIRQKMAEQYYQ